MNKTLNREKKAVIDFEPVITTEQAATILGGIHPKTLQRMARNGIVPAYFMFNKWLFRATELDKWLKTRLNANNQSVRMNKEDYVQADAL